MNYEWMAERIQAFRGTCRTVSQSPGTNDPWKLTPVDHDLEAKYRGELPTFKKIARALDVHLPGTVPNDLKQQAGVYKAVAEEALGVALDADQVKKNLAPDAPAVGADQFHPHIWNAAEPLWSTGKYRVAVGAAATSLSAHIAQKASSSLTDRSLVADVFSPKNVPGRPRLHFPGDPSTDSWRSRQEGLHLIAQGAFAGIRNPAVHGTDEWPEQHALEMLGVLSVVARWTDETEWHVDVADE